jgi:hypothetical protein
MINKFLSRINLISIYFLSTSAKNIIMRKLIILDNTNFIEFYHLIAQQDMGNVSNDK